MQDQVIGNVTKRFAENGVMCLKFHPEEQILLSTDINGYVHFNLFDVETNKCSFPQGLSESPFAAHKQGGSCRTLDFLSSCTKIVTGGQDRKVVVSSFDPKIVSKYSLPNPVNVVKSLTENLLLAGDDEGALTGIDIRQSKQIFSIHEQEDFISSICPALPSASPLKAVIATSGDATLAVYDLRVLSTDSDKKRSKNSLVAMSDPQEDELNSCIVLNQEHHVLTGDASGVVGIWKQGYWGDLKDRLPLYPRSESSMDGAHSIEGMKKLNEKEYVVVTSDGIIRQINLFPNEVSRLVGVHRNPDDTEVTTITAFDCDVDLGLVATSAGDSNGTIKFWSLKKSTDHLENTTGGDSPKVQKQIQQSSAKASKQSFFSDL